MRGFRSEFTLRISNLTSEHLNGMAFVIQSEGVSAQGVGGGGLGYGDVNTPGVNKGIINSFAIEFDTHKDADASGINALNDPNDNHISLHSRGVGNANSADELYAIVNASTAINPLVGATTRVVVHFAPPTLAISVAPLTGPVFNLTNFDLSSLIALDSFGAAFVGFTASTGGASGESFEVLDWSYDYIGAPDALKCRVFGDGAVNAVAGEFAVAYLQLVDQFGNNYTTTANVNATLATPSNQILIDYMSDG